MTGAWKMYALSDDLHALGARVRAALPISLVQAAGPEGALVALQGGDVDWVHRAWEAAEAGARGLVVERPSRPNEASCERLATLAERLPIVLRRPYVSHPALLADRDSWPHRGTTLLVTGEQFVHPDSDLADAVFDHLSAVRAIAGRPSQAHVHAFDANGYSLSASSASGADIVLVGIVSAAEPPRLETQIVASPQRLTVTLLTEATSRPGEIVITDPDGERRLPTTYEDVHRSAWRRLIDAAEHDAPVADVADFVADIASAVEALP